MASTGRYIHMVNGIYVTSLLKSGRFSELPQTSVSFSQVFSQNHIIPRLVAIKITEMVSHHIHLCAKLFYHLILSPKSSDFYLIYYEIIS